MSFIVAVAPALHCGGCCAGTFLGVVWPFAVFYTGAVEGCGAADGFVRWCCRPLCAALFSCGACGWSVFRRSPFVFSAWCLGCCRTEDLGVSGASTTVVSSSAGMLAAAGLQRLCSAAFRFGRGSCRGVVLRDLMSRDLVTLLCVCMYVYLYMCLYEYIYLDGLLQWHLL